MFTVYMCQYVSMIYLDSLFVLVIVYLLLCFTPSTELLNLDISNAGLHGKMALADVKCNTRINKSLKKEYKGVRPHDPMMRVGDLVNLQLY